MCDISYTHFLLQTTQPASEKSKERFYVHPKAREAQSRGQKQTGEKASTTAPSRDSKVAKRNDLSKAQSKAKPPHKTRTYPNASSKKTNNG